MTKRKNIAINIFLLLVLLISVVRIFLLTGWHEVIFESKYEKAEFVVGGPGPEGEEGEFEAELLEFNGKFNTNGDIVVKVTKTGDRALFKNGDEVYINGAMKYYNEATGEKIVLNDGIPEDMQVKIGDKVMVYYSWNALQFEYSNCFVSSLIKKDGRKYIPQGTYAYKIINLPEE